MFGALILCSIMPVVMRHAENTPFAVSFLTSWGAYAKRAFEDNLVSRIFQQVWDPMLASFHIGTSDLEPTGD